MDEDCIRLLNLLLKYSNDKTLGKIYHLIYAKKTKNSLLKEDLAEYSYCILNQIFNFTDNIKEDAKIKELEKFLEMLLQVINKSNCINISSESIKKIEKLVELIIKTKKIIYWENAQNGIAILYYCEFNNISDLNKFNHCKQIITEKGYLYLVNNNKKVKIKNNRQIPKKIKINKFINLYEAFANALNENTNYCPWCNPNKTLRKTKKQRKCLKCNEIMKAITLIDTWNAENLNKYVVRNTSKNATYEILLEQHKSRLLTILERNKENQAFIQNLTKNNKNFDQLKEMIETQFQSKKN